MKKLVGRIIFSFLVIILIAMAGMNHPVQAQTPVPGNSVYIYLFWGEGCPHCALAKPYFESLTEKYPNIILKEYEVYYNEADAKIFTHMIEKYGLPQYAVPTIFIGPYYMQGYAEAYNESIVEIVNYCTLNYCPDALTFDPSAPTPTPTPVPTEATQTAAGISPSHQAETSLPDQIEQSHTLDIPLIGTVNLDLQSSTISTILIAFIDGFNPCSLWVLSMLLALTLHTGSRKKVFLIGFIFLTVTAVIYALFIAGLFSVLKIASFLKWIQVVVAVVALFFGLVNIKDYFWYKAGLSFTIDDRKKSGIFKRIRQVMDASTSFWGLVGSTIVLAAGVSLVEFSCTAGFPVLWVNLLNAQQVTGGAFVLLLLLYMLIYQLDEMVIFSSAVISLKASRLEEKHGRILKLIGGMLMLTLSIVMLVNPALMNSLLSSLIIFGIAFAATLLVLLVHRVILPKWGVRFGTEPAQKIDHHEKEKE